MRNIVNPNPKFWNKKSLADATGQRPRLIEVKELGAEITGYLATNTSPNL